jgi:ABC-type uncharacterized transport system permease subunit
LRRGALLLLVRSLPIVLALLAAVLLGLVVAILLGASPFEIGRRLMSGIIVSPYGWGQVLYKATFLTLPTAGDRCCTRPRFSFSQGWRWR